MTPLEAARELRKARGWSLIQRHINNLSRDNPAWKAKRNAIAEKISTGFTFAIIGPQGRGKTQLGADVMCLASDKSMTSEYTSAMGFFLEIKATYDREEGITEMEVLKSFCRPQLLVIDELEKRSDSDWANNLLFELINRRYGMLRDTLLISNLDKQQFDKFIGPSLTDRLNETGGIIPCTWPSFRV